MLEEFEISLDNHKFNRKNMVKHLEDRGIADTFVLKAMKEIPREEFVPPELRTRAYDDGSLPIGANQTISQPYVVALMISALALTEESKVLEIGTGSGYNAAVLSKVAKEVYSVEIIPTLYFQTKETLEDLGYSNVHIKLSDGNRGWREHAPYDGIVLTAATPQVSQELFDQLKLNAILIAPVGRGEIQSLMKYRKGMNGEIHKEELLSVRFVKMFSMKEGKSNEENAI